MLGEGLTVMCPDGINHLKPNNMDTPLHLSPQLAGRKTVFENRRILRYLRIAGRVARANRKQFDAPDDEDRGEEGCPNSEPQVQTRLDRTACSAGWFNQE